LVQNIERKKNNWRGCKIADKIAKGGDPLGEVKSGAKLFFSAHLNHFAQTTTPTTKRFSALWG
jgi:hypothetical protein